MSTGSTAPPNPPGIYRSNPYASSRRRRRWRTRRHSSPASTRSTAAPCDGYRSGGATPAWSRRGSGSSFPTWFTRRLRHPRRFRRRRRCAGTTRSSATRSRRRTWVGHPRASTTSSRPSRACRIYSPPPRAGRGWRRPFTCARSRARFPTSVLSRRSPIEPSSSPRSPRCSRRRATTRRAGRPGVTYARRATS